MMHEKTFSKQKTSLLAILFGAFLGGGVSPLSKIVLMSIPPLSFTLIRFALALGLLLVIVRQKIRITKNELPVLALSLLSTANIMLFAYGVKRTTATIAQTLYAAVPIIAIVLSWLILKEKMTRYKIIGTIIGLVGFLMIVFLPTIGNKSVLKGDLWGNLLIFMGVVAYSFYTVLSKKFQKKYSPAQLIFYFFLTTFMVQLFLAPIELISYPQWWQNITTHSLMALAYVIIGATVISYWLHQYIIKIAGPVIASMGFYVTPVAAFIWSAILLHERLTAPFLIGAVLTLSGVWLATQSKKRAMEKK